MVAVAFLPGTAKYLSYRIFRTQLTQWKENLYYTLVYCSYGLMLMLWIWIRTSLDPDLFWLDPDP
jgi:hypothetical protein